MKKGMIVTVVILSFLIIAVKSNAEMKITPDGVTFPYGNTQQRAWTLGTDWWLNHICYDPTVAIGGYVGIGTKSPQAKLHIKGNDFPNTFIYLDTNAANQDAGIRFYENASMKGHLFHDASEGLLRLESNQAQLVLRSSDGNVGIGTTDPSDKLEVAGNIHVSGNGNGVKFPDGTVQTTAAAPTWHQILPAADRFKLVMNSNAAVLDKETGLVWEKSPDTTQRYWTTACTHCYKREVGGRKGWRLPTIEELASLVDTSQSYPALPAGDPFTNVQSGHYWSSSTSSATSALDAAWYVHFMDGFVGPDGKGWEYYVWCVRGGYGHDAY